MELGHYLSITRRWLWLLLLGLIIGLVSGYIIAALQTPVYQSSTRVVVSRASMQTASGATSSGNLYDYFLSDQVLIQTYVELLKSSSIFDHVSQIVNYPVSSNQVSANQVNETRIISITAEDTDPQRAADIANAVVQALITQNEELEAGRYKSSDESLQIQIRQVEEQIAKYQDDLDSLSTITAEEQIAEVQAQMTPLQAEVTQLQKDIAVLSPAWSAERKEKVAELQARLDQIQPLLALYQQIYTDLTVSGASGGSEHSATNNPAAARLEKTLSLYQQIYLNLINTREAIRLARMQNTQSVNQIEVAAPPSNPIRPKPTQNTLLGGVIGLMLAGAIVFLIEYLDDTLKTPEDVERLLELPMIGYIADMELGSEVDRHNIGILVAQKPRSPVAEAFRSLRTNLEFSSVDKPLKTILVTSAEASDGKSTVSINLAAIFAQGGKRVILIDCDMRRPRIHRFIGVQNRIGMTDLFRGNHTLDEVTHKWSDASGLGISIITSGSLPPNPAELLGSQKMNSLLKEMSTRADVVIIDSPPSMVADAQVLAAKVDGVVVVAQPGKTHAGAARITLDQLNRAGAHIIGVVFNRIQRQRGYYYGGYRYYSPYYYQNDSYLNSPSQFEQHPIEPDERPVKSFFKNIFASRKRAEYDDDKLENTPPRVMSNLINPAGWQKTKEKKNAKIEAVKNIANKEGKPASSLLKSASEENMQSTPPPAMQVKTLREDQPPTVAQRLLLRRVLSGKKRVAASSPSLLGKPQQYPAQKLKTPGLIVPSSAQGSGLLLPGNGNLIGTDYKFLIHKSSDIHNLLDYAEKYHTEVKSILEVNYKIPSAAMVFPVGFSDVSDLPRFTAYEVKQTGRTLEALADELNVSLYDLKYYNGVKDERKIWSGDWLLIPHSPSLPLPDPAFVPSGNPAKRHGLDVAIGTSQKFVIHKVLEDENLHEHASRYKTSLEAILTVTTIPPLQTGTIAVIPVEITDTTGLPRFETYKVQGESRSAESLTQELNVDLDKLRAYNDIQPGEKLEDGDWLLIPRSRASALWRSASVAARV